MIQKISLKEAERKAFTTIFQDGLWDILIASFVLMFAVGPFLSQSLGDFWSSFIFLPVWVLVLLAVWLLKKYVVAPRLGMVKFGTHRRTRLTWLTVVMLIINLVAMGLGTLSMLFFQRMPSWLPSLIFSIIFLILFSTAAFFLNFTRLYIYGILFALSPLVGEWLYQSLKVPHHGFPVTFGFSAFCMLLTGLILFVQFLHRYPLPTNDFSSG